MDGSVVHRPNRHPTMLDKQPGLIELVAEMYAAGWKPKDMLEELPISTRSTLNEWLKDERVILHVETLLREKSIRIRRRIDTELEARVSDPKMLRMMPPESLLKIRAELSKDFPDRTRVLEALYLEAADNPAAAELIAKLNLDPEGEVIGSAVEMPDPDEPPAQIEEAEVIDPDEVLERMAERRRKESIPDTNGGLGV